MNALIKCMLLIVHHPPLSTFIKNCHASHQHISKHPPSNLSLPNPTSQKPTKNEYDFLNPKLSGETKARPPQKGKTHHEKKKPRGVIARQ